MWERAPAVGVCSMAAMASLSGLRALSLSETDREIVWENLDSERIGCESTDPWQLTARLYSNGPELTAPLETWPCCSSSRSSP